MYLIGSFSDLSFSDESSSEINLEPCDDELSSSSAEQDLTGISTKVPKVKEWLQGE